MQGKKEFWKKVGDCTWDISPADWKQKYLMTSDPCETDKRWNHTSYRNKGLTLMYIDYRVIHCVFYNFCMKKWTFSYCPSRLTKMIQNTWLSTTPFVHEVSFPILSIKTDNDDLKTWLTTLLQEDTKPDGTCNFGTQHSSIAHSK
jgi:hypothetical protein